MEINDFEKWVKEEVLEGNEKDIKEWDNLPEYAKELSRLLFSPLLPNTIQSLEELDGKANEKFTIRVKDGLLNVTAELSRGTYCLYKNTTDKVQDILKDLQVFGFTFTLKKADKITRYYDEDGKLVGKIVNGKAELGKHKYINLAELYRWCEKDIEKFNSEVKTLGIRIK